MNNIIQVNTKKAIGKASVNSLLPQLKVIAEHWGLDLKKAKQFNTAKRILINSVINN